MDISVVVCWWCKYAISTTTSLFLLSDGDSNYNQQLGKTTKYNKTPRCNAIHSLSIAPLLAAMLTEGKHRRRRQPTTSILLRGVVAFSPLDPWGADSDATRDDQLTGQQWQGKQNATLAKSCRVHRWDYGAYCSEFRRFSFGGTAAHTELDSFMFQNSVLCIWLIQVEVQQF